MTRPPLSPGRERRPTTLAAMTAALAAAALLAGCNLAPIHQTPALPVPDTVGTTGGQPAVASDASVQAAAALGWVQAHSANK